MVDACVFEDKALQLATPPPPAAMLQILECLCPLKGELLLPHHLGDLLWDAHDDIGTLMFT